VCLENFLEYTRFLGTEPTTVNKEANSVAVSDWLVKYSNHLPKQILTHLQSKCLHSTKVAIAICQPGWVLKHEARITLPFIHVYGKPMWTMHIPTLSQPKRLRTHVHCVGTLEYDICECMHIWPQQDGWIVLSYFHASVMQWPLTKHVTMLSQCCL